MQRSTSTRNLMMGAVFMRQTMTWNQVRVLSLAAGRTAACIRVSFPPRLCHTAAGDLIRTGRLLSGAGAEV